MHITFDETNPFKSRKDSFDDVDEGMQRMNINDQPSTSQQGGQRSAQNDQPSKSQEPQGSEQTMKKMRIC